MAAQVLYDSVTLQHLAVAKLLGLLEGMHGGRDEPRWVTAVKSEIDRGTARFAHCRDVIAFKWLGTAQEPNDLKEVFRIQRALASEGDSPSKNLGEAMSIALAEELDGFFVTDDRLAFDFAQRRAKLGVGRISDTCSLLDDAVSVGEITAEQRKVAHKDMIDFGRNLRDCRCTF